MLAHDADLVNFLAHTRHDPLLYVQYAYAWGQGDLEGELGPRVWQSEVLDYIGRRLRNPATRHLPIRIAVASGHGIGKSALFGMISDWGMATFEDTIVMVTANTETQLRTKTSPEIGRWFRRSVSCEMFDTNIMAIHATDKQRKATWKLDFVTWSEHNTEAFQGLHNKNKRIIILMDEGSAIAEKVMEVTQGALTDANTEIIWIIFSNPTRNVGFFRECFRNNRRFWWTKNIDAREVPGTNRALHDDLASQYGEDSNIFKVRVRGMFPTTSGKQFITGDDVDAAYNRHLKPAQFNFAPKIIGVDPAWEGDDEFVIMLRQGLFSKVLGTYEKNDNDVVMARLIRRFEQEEGADAVFVDGGFGTGIVSAGQAMGASWQLVWFGGKSPDAGMLNMRSYMWDQMRQWLKTGAAIPPDQILYQDLTAPEIVPRLDGKVQLESKKDMKDKLLPSPNRADALALTFAQPVAKRIVQSAFDSRPISENAVEADYAPFSGS